MAVICRGCAMNKSMPKESLPPVRTRKAPCDICGGQNEDPRGLNYSVPDALMPGDPTNPDVVAEREEMNG